MRMDIVGLRSHTTTRSGRALRRAVAGLVALVTASVLSGCAGADTSEPGGPGTPSSDAHHSPGLGVSTDPSTDPLACGIAVSPLPAEVGADLVISRAPAVLTDACSSVVPGSTQTLELRSIRGSDQSTSVTVPVAADGSFTTTMPIPDDLRLGDSLVTLIPPTGLACTAPGEATMEDCILPRVHFEVGHNPDELTPVQIISTSTDLAQTTLAELNSAPYAVAGPGPNELTLVMDGNACPTRPASFVNTAPPGSLEIVSEDIYREGITGCGDLFTLWTTVIIVPNNYADFDLVKIDNIDAFYER